VNVSVIPLFTILMPPFRKGVFRGAGARRHLRSVRAGTSSRVPSDG
jgi:hypothetical protein